MGNIMTRIKKEMGGRSMVEMLGVLAVIAVLSIGGLAGYTHGMRIYRKNKTVAHVDLTVIGAATALNQSDFPAGENTVDMTELMERMEVIRNDDKNNRTTLVFLSGGPDAQAGKTGHFLEIYIGNANAYTCKTLFHDYAAYIENVAIITGGTVLSDMKTASEREWFENCKILERSTGGAQAAEPEGRWLKFTVDLEKIGNFAETGIRAPETGECPMGTYKDKNLCKSCPIHCDVCPNGNTCTQCNPAYPIWNTQQCVACP